MAAPRAQARRSFWLKHLHRWHWISAAISLVAMLLFAATGITLNHAGAIETKPKIIDIQGTLPPTLLNGLSSATGADGNGKAPLPREIRTWLADRLHIPTTDAAAEWSEDEVYLAMPRPGGDAWVSIDRESGAVSFENTDRGWIAYLNDLHKGRNAGTAWSWFIDIFAAACLIFSITGLVLLQLHAGSRPATWPLVVLGLVVPVLLALIFIH